MQLLRLLHVGCKAAHNTNLEIPWKGWKENLAGWVTRPGGLSVCGESKFP